MFRGRAPVQASGKQKEVLVIDCSLVCSWPEHSWESGRTTASLREKQVAGEWLRGRMPGKYHGRHWGGQRFRMPQVHAPIDFSAAIQKDDANAPGTVFHGMLGPGDLGEPFP